MKKEDLKAIFDNITMEEENELASWQSGVNAVNSLSGGCSGGYYTSSGQCVYNVPTAVMGVRG
jgi:hypothetical protein